MMVRSCGECGSVEQIMPPLENRKKDAICYTVWLFGGQWDAYKNTDTHKTSEGYVVVRFSSSKSPLPGIGFERQRLPDVVRIPFSPG